MYIDKIKFDHKPTDQETAKIQGRKKTIRAQKRIELDFTIDEVMTAAAEGQTIIFSDLNNSTKWLIFDLDKGTSTKEFFEKIKEVLPLPNAIYTSFSHTEEVPKYRAIWEMDTRISQADYKKLYKYLEEKTGYITDTKCSDSTRLFFGSNKRKGFRKILHRDLLKLSTINFKSYSIHEPIQRAEGASQSLKRILELCPGAKGILSEIHVDNDNSLYTEVAVQILNGLKYAGLDIDPEEIEQGLIIKLDYNGDIQHEHKRYKDLADLWRNPNVYKPKKGSKGADLLKKLYSAGLIKKNSITTNFKK